MKGATISRSKRRRGAEIISIHAPVKGATPDMAQDGHLHLISIHAPVKGATEIAAAMFSQAAIFQSTHP